jgi:hypothetical protein
MVAGPLALFGVKIQVDTGYGISRQDHPRMAVWRIQWFELMANFFESFFSLWQPSQNNALSMQEIKSSVSLQTFIVASKLFTVQILNFAGINIRMAHNISGMLSSSFQGNND